MGNDVKLFTASVKRQTWQTLCTVQLHILSFGLHVQLQRFNLPGSFNELNTKNMGLTKTQGARFGKSPTQYPLVICYSLQLNMAQSK